MMESIHTSGRRRLERHENVSMGLSSDDGMPSDQREAHEPCQDMVVVVCGGRRACVVGLAGLQRAEEVGRRRGSNEDGDGEVKEDSSRDGRTGQGSETK
jgi:hypothetical protein